MSEKDFTKKVCDDAARALIAAVECIPVAREELAKATTVRDVSKMHDCLSVLRDAVGAVVDLGKLQPTAGAS